MSSESAPKPRFVLCPKCRLLLQEPPNFDVYKCGGCGTTLQAKKRKSRAANSESSSHVTDAAAPRNASDLVSDDKQYSNGENPVSPQKNVSREISTNSLSVESSSEVNEGRNQIENSECNEQPVTTQENGSREKATFSSSEECSSEENIARGLIENGECNEEQTATSQKNALKEKRTSSSSGECSLDGNGERGQIEKGECNEEQPVISQENDLNEKATSSEECSLDGNSRRVQIENGECDEEQLVPFNLSDEEPEDEVDIYKLSDIRRHTVSNKGYLNELPQASAKSMVDNSAEKANVTNLKLEKEQSNGTNKVDSKELDSGNLLLQRTEEDIGGNASTNERLSTENFVSEKGNISYVSSRELKEGTSDNHASSPKNILHSFDDLKSVDTFDNTEVNNLSLEIIGALGKLSKSPTTRSSHAYDGSVSSNDGMDEWFLGQNLYSFEGGSRKGKGGAVKSSMLYEDVETQSQSNFRNRKYQNEVLETTRRDHANRMRTKTDEFPFPFKMPLRGSGAQSGYESGSPLNQIYDELYCSSSYVSPNSVEDPDQEKMKLLRMVYKLQNQLNRTSHENTESNERPPVGNHVSAYQSHDFHERRFNHGLDYPRGNANPSYSHDINWNQRRRNFSRIPYSTEPTSSSQHVDHPCLNCHPQERQRLGEFPPPVDHPCLNCYPQERQRSGEFPPHFPYPREDLYRPHPSHTRCLSHKYYPSSSPQWLINSKLVHGRETKYCDQRHGAPEMNYTREKPILNKRHYRPVAGGAPFVTCHNCLKLVQLPADFLVFKRVCHKLKCGACQKVLKFSLQNRSHIVSYVPNAVEPSSSDLDIQTKLINGINSHAADPVSYSDDYDHSLSKNHSSEGELVSVAPLHHSHDGACNNPTVSPSTVEAIRKEKIVSRGPSTSKAASNVSSEREAPQSLQKPSALHQLMGYTSPSQVIRGASYSDEGKDTSPSQVIRGAPYSNEGKEVMKYIFGERGIIN